MTVGTLGLQQLWNLHNDAGLGGKQETLKSQLLCSPGGSSHRTPMAGQGAQTLAYQYLTSPLTHGGCLIDTCRFHFYHSCFVFPPVAAARESVCFLDWAWIVPRGLGSGKTAPEKVMWSRDPAGDTDWSGLLFRNKGV